MQQYNYKYNKRFSICAHRYKCDYRYLYDHMHGYLLICIKPERHLAKVSQPSLKKMATIISLLPLNFVFIRTYSQLPGSKYSRQKWVEREA